MAMISVDSDNTKVDLGLRLSGALVVLLVALPIANSALEVRVHGSTSAITPLVAFLVPLFAVTLLISALITLANVSTASDQQSWPRQIGGGIFISLLAWLLVSHLRVGEFNFVRNMAAILATFIVLFSAAVHGLAVSRLLRMTTRLAVLYSIYAYLVDPLWYVNASKYFVDSGKIIDTLPNAQGLLSHANYTALFFSATLVIEVAMWGRHSRKGVSALFAALSSIIMFTTQGRNAILAAVIALICVIGYRRGKAAWASGAVIVALIAAWLPFALMIPAYFSGGAPNYDWLGAVTNRGALWTAIAEVLPQYILMGHGSAAIIQANQFVLDPEIAEVTHGHNEVLNLLLVGGLPAAILYSVLLCVVAARIRTGRAPAAGVGLMVVLAFTGITESPLGPYITLVGVVLLIVAVVLLFAADDSELGPHEHVHRIPEARGPTGDVPRVTVLEGRVASATGPGGPQESGI